MNKIKTAGVVILIVLALLIFFSNTIYNYNIPEVTAALPKNGRLSKSETSTGIADWADTYEIYFEMGGKVEELLVEEGDYITEGELMARLSFDVDDTELKLRQLEIERNKTQVSIETTNLRISKLESQIANLRSEDYEEDEISDYTIVQLEAKIEKSRDSYVKAEESYSRLEILYEVGAVAKQELDSGRSTLENAAYELESLQLDYENAKKIKSESEEKNIKSLADKEKNRQTQIDDCLYEIENARRDIQTKNLEIQKNIEEQASYNKLLQTYSDNICIYAPRSGKIISIGTSATPVKAGQIVNKNQFFASIGLGNTFNIVCNLSLKNNFVVVGDECRIGNIDHSYVASVTKLEPTDVAKAVTVRVSDDEITAGETFDVEFGKEAAKTATLIPNGAVNKDSDNYFVYYIKKRKGILGEEYYAEKVPVYIGDSDNENTIITRGITFFEPIIQLSDKPLSDGDTIKVKNEGDFFVD